MSQRRGEVAAGAAIVALFLLVRGALLVVREPFFDELFTVWMAGRPFGAILPALLHDSGPPLYYFVARFTDVFALRLLSLLFATATLLLILTRRSLGPSRFVAAALLAVYPPAALFAVDARAYALCGLFVALGVIALREERPYPAALALVFAAYAHWYGALFLPLLLLGQPRRRWWRASALAAVAFLPGLLLALRQPKASIAWMSDVIPFAALPFAGGYPESLMLPASVVLIIVSSIALVAAVWGTRTGAAAVVLPMVLVIGAGAYFPMRFESVLAVPLVLWIACAGRRAAVAVLALSGLIAIVAGVADHQARPLDEYRRAALVLRQVAAGGEPVVASGYLYLEAVDALSERRVRPFPAEQGRHPGWRVREQTREPLPPPPFLWISERGAPELAALRGRPVRVLYQNEAAVILRVQ